MLPPSTSAVPSMRQWQCEIPMTSHSAPSGMILVCSWSDSTEAGMPPMETIRSATYNSADLLDQLDHLGTLEPGKLADLVAVPRNPLDDISVLYNGIDFVMQNGIVYKQDGAPTPHAIGGL